MEREGQRNRGGLFRWQSFLFKVLSEQKAVTSCANLSLPIAEAWLKVIVIK